MSCDLKLVLIQIKQHHLRAEHLSVCTGTTATNNNNTLATSSFSQFFCFCCALMQKANVNISRRNLADTCFIGKTFLICQVKCWTLVLTPKVSLTWFADQLWTSVENTWSQFNLVIRSNAVDIDVNLNSIKLTSNLLSVWAKLQANALKS